MAYGWQPEGIELVPVIKAQSPRIDSETGKQIKYETPKGAAAVPYFALVPYAYGLSIARKLGLKELQAYENRIGVVDIGQIDHNFWPWVIDRSWPITITEGVKKALALIAQGVIAIGLRGVAQWRTPKTNDLSQSLKPFIGKKRKWQIALDQDTKPTTRAAVRGQILKFGRAIDRKGGEVSIIEWEATQGKGIDDLLAGAGESAQDVLAGIISDARSLANYQRDLKSTLADIANLQSIEGVPTVGARLAILPNLTENDLLVIDSTMGTGKTYRMIADLINPAKVIDRLTVVIAPNNNLCKQFGQQAGLCHMHDYGTKATDSEALKADIYHRGGVVLCLDSLPRLLALCPGILAQKTLVIFDEINQVLSNAAAAGTLGKRQPKGIKALGDLIGSAHSIAIAEYGIPDRCVDFVRLLGTDLKVKRIFHRHNSEGWQAKMYRGQDSGFFGAFLAAVEAGGRHYFTSTSRAKLERLELLLLEAFPHKKLVRIDSETIDGGVFEDLFRDPDRWLRENQVDILLASPTLQSGVSIDGGKTVEESYFTAVWGHFGTLAPDLHLQMLARVRPGVLRHIWTPDTIRRSPDEYGKKTWGQLRFWQQHANYQAEQHGLEVPKELSSVETLIQSFHAENLIVSGLQKSIAFGYLKSKLEDAGCSIEVIETDSDKSLAESFRRARNLLDLDEAEKIAATEIDSEIYTLNWAKSELGAISSTVATRRLANKILARERFPGQLFDDFGSALGLVENYGALARAAELRAAAEQPAVERMLEKAAVVEILGAEIRAYHRLPNRGNQARVLSDLGILELVESDAEYSSESKLVIDIAARAVELAAPIWRFFGLVIKASQSPVEICHKFLRRLGLEIDRDNRPGAISQTSRTGSINNQIQNYRIVAHPNAVYQGLVVAARLRRELIAVISKGGSTPLTNHRNESETIAAGDIDRVECGDPGAARISEGGIFEIVCDRSAPDLATG